MAKKLEEQEAKVRPLREAGLSTWKIADVLGPGFSQPTVVRVLKRINSGPHPILQLEEDPGTLGDSSPETEPLPAASPVKMPAQQPPSRRPERESSQVGWILVIAMIVLAVLIVCAVWYKLSRVPIVPSSQSRVPACVTYSSTGQIAQIALASHNHCGKGWRLLDLVPNQ